MFCNHCGKQVENSATFCPNCGKAVNLQQNGQQGYQQYPQQGTYVQTKKTVTQNKKIIIIVAAVVAVLLIGFTVYSLVNSHTLSGTYILTNEGTISVDERDLGVEQFIFKRNGTFVLRYNDESAKGTYEKENGYYSASMEYDGDSEQMIIRKNKNRLIICNPDDETETLVFIKK